MFTENTREHRKHGTKETGRRYNISLRDNNEYIGMAMFTGNSVYAMVMLSSWSIYILGSMRLEYFGQSYGSMAYFYNINCFA